MAGHTKKELALWFRQILEAHPTWTCPADVARDTKIPLTSVLYWATEGGMKRSASNILHLSEVLDVPVELLIRAIAGQLDLADVLKHRWKFRTITMSHVKQPEQENIDRPRKRGPVILSCNNFIGLSRAA